MSVDVTLSAILILAALGVPVSAVATLLLKLIEPSWSARQRVFNSAAICPALLAVGGACFTTVILIMGKGGWITGSSSFLLQILTSIFASYSAGLLAAYLVERLTGP